MVYYSKLCICCFHFGWRILVDSEFLWTFFSKRARLLQIPVFNSYPIFLFKIRLLFSLMSRLVTSQGLNLDSFHVKIGNITGVKT